MCRAITGKCTRGKWKKNNEVSFVSKRSGIDDQRVQQCCDLQWHMCQPTEAGDAGMELGDLSGNVVEYCVTMDLSMHSPGVSVHSSTPLARPMRGHRTQHFTRHAERTSLKPKVLDTRSYHMEAGASHANHGAGAVVLAHC